MLRTPAEPVRDFDAELRKLVKDLTDTMLEAPGLGLAAPQIGVGLRVFTYFVDDELGHLINPSLDLTADTETDDEGCLSFPGLAFPTERAFGAVADEHGVQLKAAIAKQLESFEQNVMALGGNETAGADDL